MCRSQYQTIRSMSCTLAIREDTARTLTNRLADEGLVLADCGSFGRSKLWRLTPEGYNSCAIKPSPSLDNSCTIKPSPSLDNSCTIKPSPSLDKSYPSQIELNWPSPSMDPCKYSSDRPKYEVPVSPAPKLRPLCPRCKKPLNRFTKYCTKCGYKLHGVSQIRCNVCKSLNLLSDSYCGSCGSKLEETIQDGTLFEDSHDRLLF